ncbi:hypothetical protein [Sorangium sp. So ce1182]|uniref:hypothetical protein n=1 Tax=Sorangium sp. So ce1182 TaxID=3133334 RepID=UPI003F641C86
MQGEAATSEGKRGSPPPAPRPPREATGPSGDVGPRLRDGDLGPNGLAVVQAALVALGRLDQEHALVYFQLIWNGLREPMQQALEALVMERQIEGEATSPPFVQKLIDRGKLAGIREGELEGIREGELKGLREGKLEGKRDTLLRLLARAGIALTENESARIQTCTDTATLDRWVDNVLGAKTATEGQTWSGGFGRRIDW